MAARNSQGPFATGATLYLTARNLSKSKEALGDELTQSPRVHLLELDFESIASVRACAAQVLALKNTSSTPSSRMPELWKRILNSIQPVLLSYLEAAVTAA
ncbi:hypothetical protein BDV09DRAFT_201302 [Aspergillus tetrazonus]